MIIFNPTNKENANYSKMWSTVERKLVEAGYQVKNGKDKIGRYRIVTH